MTRTMLALYALVAFAAKAGTQEPRVVRALEKSYELGVGDLIAPATPLGSVSIKPCASCARVAHFVTAATVYLYNDKRVSFEELQRLLDERRVASRPTFVGVYYGVDTDAVTRIRLKTQ